MMNVINIYDVTCVIKHYEEMYLTLYSHKHLPQEEEREAFPHMPVIIIFW